LGFIVTWSDEKDGITSPWKANLKVWSGLSLSRCMADFSKALVWLGMGCLLGGIGFYFRLRIHDDFIESFFSWIFWVAGSAMGFFGFHLWKEKGSRRRKDTLFGVEVIH
jgi:hypothetical protein